MQTMSHIKGFNHKKNKNKNTPKLFFCLNRKGKSFRKKKKKKADVSKTKNLNCCNFTILDKF